MPRYSLSDLVNRANAGQIGYRGIRRLQQAGLSDLANSGVASPLTADPTADLSARRGALYGQAEQRALAGGPLSAATQHRLELGPGGAHSADTFAPHSQAEVQALGDHAIQQNVEALRRRASAINSAGAVYGGWRG